MKTTLASVMWIGFACVVTASPPSPTQQTVDQVQLPLEFVGEPDTIQAMRLGDSYWVPARGLVIDKHANCWIKKSQKLDQKSPHMIQVYRLHDKDQTNRVLYGVRIERKKLKGWMWQLGLHEGSFYVSTGHAPVASLEVTE